MRAFLPSRSTTCRAERALSTHEATVSKKDAAALLHSSSTDDENFDDGALLSRSPSFYDQLTAIVPGDAAGEPARAVSDDDECVCWDPSVDSVFQDAISTRSSSSGTSAPSSPSVDERATGADDRKTADGSDPRAFTATPTWLAIPPQDEENALAKVLATSSVSSDSDVSENGESNTPGLSSCYGDGTPHLDPAALEPMTSIRDALRRCPDTQHPFLDLNEQQRRAAADRQQRHADYCQAMNEAAATTTGDQVVMCKLLCREAHRLQVRRAEQRRRLAQSECSSCSSTYSDSTACASPAPPKTTTTGAAARTHRVRSVKRINSQWTRIAQYVSSDLEHAEDSMNRETVGFVQRRLSCMCIFNSQSDDRHYNDNEGFRMARTQRQYELLVELDEQRQAGSTSLFLI